MSCASHDPSEPSPNFSTLLVGTNDPRHIFTTTARSRRHGSSADAAPPTTSFFVHESSTVELARHVLLLCVLMTDDVPPADRVERFLEIFGNFTLRESTSQLVQRLAARLERVVGAIFAGETTDAPNSTPDRIATVFDFSLLKFKEKDALMDVFRSWGGDDVNSKHFDPDKTSLHFAPRLRCPWTRTTCTTSGAFPRRLMCGRWCGSAVCRVVGFVP